MSSTNQSPFYQRAEQKFREATSDEERISCFEIMIKECPKHKSSENMRKNLTNRMKKLRENIIKRKKSGKGKRPGIRKAEIQCILVGFSNTGKSTIFKTLSNLNPVISPYPFATYVPQLGTFKFENTPIQIIDIPSFPNHDKSLINSTDTILFVIDNIDQIKKAEEYFYGTKAKIIILLNKEDKLSAQEKRKIEATLKSKYKKYLYFILSKKSTKTKIEELKKVIFETFPIIRVYTKEPRKEADKKPMILRENSTFKEATDKIMKGVSKKIQRARIWGPSSKFGGQTIGLRHILKDKDIIEFQTR